jgi:hypothetical protein
VAGLAAAQATASAGRQRGRAGRRGEQAIGVREDRRIVVALQLAHQLVERARVDRPDPVALQQPPQAAAHQQVGAGDHAAATRWARREAAWTGRVRTDGISGLTATGRTRPGAADY